jgi:hypothetical protein
LIEGKLRYGSSCALAGRCSSFLLKKGYMSSRAGNLRVQAKVVDNNSVVGATPIVLGTPIDRNSVNS